MEKTHNMLNAVQIVDSNFEFQSEVQEFIQQHQLQNNSSQYKVISIIGKQHSGKSTLLNDLFDVSFPVREFDEMERTTTGIWMALNQQTKLLLFDTEGSDSDQQSNEDDFDIKISLFMLCVSDLLVINLTNMQESQSRYMNNLLNTMINKNIELNLWNCKKMVKKLLFVVRNFSLKLDFLKVRQKIEEKFQENWEKIRSQLPEKVKEEPYQSFFQIEVVSLPNKQDFDEQYQQQINILKQRFLPGAENPIFLPSEEEREESFSHTLLNFWLLILLQQNINTEYNKIPEMLYNQFYHENEDLYGKKSSYRSLVALGHMVPTNSGMKEGISKLTSTFMTSQQLTKSSQFLFKSLPNVVSISLFAIDATFLLKDTVVDIKDWYNESIEGKRVVQKFSANSVIMASSYGFPLAGVAIGTAISPGVGSLIGAGFGIIVSIGASFFLDKVVKKWLAGILDLPKDQAVEEAFKILDLPTDSTLEVASKRFRELCIENHPKKGGNKETFVKINLAMEILRNYYNEKEKKETQTFILNMNEEEKEDQLSEQKSVILKKDLYQSQKTAKQGKIIKMKNFDFQKEINLDSFGKVTYAQNKAIKGEIIIFKKIAIVPNDFAGVDFPSMIKRFKHPFIYEVEYVFFEKGNLFVGTKYMNGNDMISRINKNGRIPENHARYIALQLILALEHFHSLNIIHNGVMPENIFYDAYGFVYLANVDPLRMLGIKQTLEFYTHEYIAPEVLMGEEITINLDWWSLGIFLYESIIGFPPFYHDDQGIMYEMIKSKNPIFPNEVIYHTQMSENCKNFILQLLKKNYNERIGAKGGYQELLAHPWFQPLDVQILLKEKNKALNLMNEEIFNLEVDIPQKKYSFHPVMCQLGGEVLDISGDNTVTLINCDDKFCINCLSNFWNEQVHKERKTLNSLCCPIQACSQPIDSNSHMLIQRVIGIEAFNKIEEDSLQNQPNLITCKKCGEKFQIGDNLLKKREIRCLRCKTRICMNCQNPIKECICN